MCALKEGTLPFKMTQKRKPLASVRDRISYKVLCPDTNKVLSIATGRACYSGVMSMLDRRKFCVRIPIRARGISIRRLRKFAKLLHEYGFTPERPKVKTKKKEYEVYLPLMSHNFTYINLCLFRWAHTDPQIVFDTVESWRQGQKNNVDINFYQCLSWAISKQYHGGHSFIVYNDFYDYIRGRTIGVSITNYLALVKFLKADIHRCPDRFVNRNILSVFFSQKELNFNSNKVRRQIAFVKKRAHILSPQLKNLFHADVTLEMINKHPSSLLHFPDKKGTYYDALY